MRIVGIHGRARSGKDTLAGFLVEHHGFHRIALADPIRQFVSSITGISVEDLMDSALKEAPLAEFGGRSPRQMMQTLGTEWGRDMIAPDLWLTVCRLGIERSKRAGAVGVVIPDVRFENEAEMVRALGGEVAHVIRDGAGAVNAHVSEVPLPDYLVDYTVNNDSTVARLALHAEVLARG